MTLLPRRKVLRVSARRLLVAFMVSACFTWAIWPIRPSSIAAIPTFNTSTGAPADSVPGSLNLTGFGAPLWFAPPPPVLPQPPVVAAPLPPPPPLRWQLLAIVGERSGFRALIYDPDSDKLFELGEGDTAGSRSIGRVTETSVEVREVAGLRTLALRESKPGDPR